MKKKSFLAICLFAALFFGCKKQEGPKTSTTPATIDIKLSDEQTIKMVAVEGSAFYYGAMSEGATTRSAAPRYENVRTFYIMETKLTFGDWYAVIGAYPTTGDWKPSSGGTTPMNYSSHGSSFDTPLYEVALNAIINKYIPALNAKTGRTFRLLTEVEWEYAARGGLKSQGYKYPGSNDLSEVSPDIPFDSWVVNPVKTRKPNELGLYDMAGERGEACISADSDYQPYVRRGIMSQNSGDVFSRFGCNAEEGDMGHYFRLGMDE